jgi:N-formylglutamate amidohydrolase
MSQLPPNAPDSGAPPFVVAAPGVQTLPIVLVSPHSGDHYLAEFLAMSRLDAMALRRSEDSHVDKLFAAAPLMGMPLLKALFPRAYVDANREAYELDPEMFDEPLPAHVTTHSSRIEAGLGTIPKVVTRGLNIYSKKLSFAEAEARIANYYRPFHTALKELVDATMAKFGHCLVIDCHSMPSEEARKGGGVDFVLGDCHGVSCAHQILAVVEDDLRRLGYQVARNEPYSGGYITSHYGKPGMGMHAFQIEINRDLYMDEKTRQLSSGFATLSQHLGEVLGGLSSLSKSAYQ